MMAKLAVAPGGMRCLIAEDEGLIGMALEACVQDEGYAVIGPFATCTAALHAFEAHTPEVGTIDYKLKDGCCLELARAFLKRNVPFLVYSGLPRLPELNPEFRDVPWLEKPTGRADLLGALAFLIQESRARVDLDPLTPRQAQSAQNSAVRR